MTEGTRNYPVRCFAQKTVVRPYLLVPKSRAFIRDFATFDFNSFSGW
jgi:hypothetical protein